MPGGIIATVQREGDARTRGSKIADAHPDLWDRSAGRRFGLRRDPGTATEARDAPPDKSNVSSQTATLIDVDGEMMRLRVIVDSAESERAWMARTQAAVAASAQTIDRPQLLVVVDRNPDVEQIRLVLARPDGAWSSLGGTKVSTGQAGRRDYYLTPTGVFLHTDLILDWRAEAHSILSTFAASGSRECKGLRAHPGDDEQVSRSPRHTRRGLPASCEGCPPS